MDKTVGQTLERLSLDSLARLPALKHFSQRVNQPSERIVFVFLAVFLVLCQVPLIGCALMALSAFFVPAIDTLQVIEKEDKTEYDRLLVYWMAFCTLHYFHTAVRALLGWLPAFTFLRFALLMGLYLPNINGAGYLAALIKQRLGTYQAYISLALNELRTRAEATWMFLTAKKK